MTSRARVTGRIVQLPVSGAADIEAVLTQLRAAGIEAEGVEMRKADLEDVFLSMMAAQPAAGATARSAT